MNPKISGVVLDVRSTSITVAFEDESVYENLCESTQMALVKLANDITHRLIFKVNIQPHLTSFKDNL